MSDIKDTEKTINFEDKETQTGPGEVPYSDEASIYNSSPGIAGKGFRNYAYSDQIPDYDLPADSAPSGNFTPEQGDSAQAGMTNSDPAWQKGHPTEDGPEPRLNWNYMPPDKEAKTANPFLLLGAIAIIAGCLILAVGILLGRLSKGVPKKADIRTEKAPTESKPATTAQTTEYPPASTQATSTEQNTVPATSQTPPTQGSLTLSDKLSDYTFSLNGVVYQLPCDYSTLFANGWSISPYSDKKETDKVPGEASVYFTLVSNDQRMTVEAYNPGKAADMLKNCKIGGISVTASSNQSFTIANNITPSSSAEEIREAFGNPDDSKEYDDYTSIKYKTNPDNYREYTNFTIYKNTEKTKFNSINLRRIILSSEDSQASGTTSPASDEKPAYLATYKPPESMNPEEPEAIFKLDGKLYQLPCPLDQFTDDGWAINKIQKASVNGLGEETNAITMEKDGVEIRLTMANYIENPVTSENCAVSGISMYSHKSSYTEPAPAGFFEGPGGIKPEMTLDQVKAALPSSTWKQYENDKTDYDSLTFMHSDYDKGISISYFWMDYQSGDTSRYIQVNGKSWSY